MSDDIASLTEEQWNTSALPYVLIDFLREKTWPDLDKRRCRLWACACCREIWSLLKDERSQQAVELAERHADHPASHDELYVMGGEASEAMQSWPRAPFKDAAKAARSAVTGDETIWSSVCFAFQYASDAYAKAATKKASARESHREAAQARQAALLRDIFGNPFRPVKLSPSCRTPAVVALAQAAYEHRLLPDGTLDPEKLAALAAALAASGAASEIVEHLRQPGPHVRGCWAVDAVLGREFVPLKSEPPPMKIDSEAPVENEFAPCISFGPGDDGVYSIGFIDFDPTAPIFEKLGHDGGGYSWHGVVEALVRMQAPKLKRKLQYDPEASMFVVLSKDQEALREVAELIRAATSDADLLKEAIANAKEDLMNP